MAQSINTAPGPVTHITSRRWRSRLARTVLAAAACAVFAGCEELADPTDIPYVDRLVIEGVVVADSAVSNIRITHTLPIDAPYRKEYTYISNATARLTTPRGEFPLAYAGEGLYGAPGAVVHPGESCTLVVEWNGKRATAHTRVPNLPVLDTFRIITNREPNDSAGGAIIGAEALLRDLDPLAVYSLSATVGHDSLAKYAVSYGLRYTLVRTADSMANGRLRVNDSTPYNFIDGRYWEFMVSAYDAPLWDLARTIGNGNDDFGVFSSTPTIRWNVQGDGIGIFVGRSSISRKGP